MNDDKLRLQVKQMRHQESKSYEQIADELGIPRYRVRALDQNITRTHLPEGMQHRAIVGPYTFVGIRRTRDVQHEEWAIPGHRLVTRKIAGVTIESWQAPEPWDTKRLTEWASMHGHEVIFQEAGFPGILKEQAE